MPDRRLGQKSKKTIVHRIAIVQIINTTKYPPKIPGILASCILPPTEVTSHTLFKDGDVMEKLIAQLRQYVADHPPDYGDGDCHSILDMLYYRYSECNRLDNDEIKATFADLYQQMHGMSLREMDRIIDVVCTLCREHEKAGFTEGIRVGIQLAKELEQRNATSLVQ